MNWRGSFALFILMLAGCATIPRPREVKFDVDWIRSTLSNDNLNYRHAERTAPLIDGD